jgi:NADH-quinone oxidoreductase subunit A
MAQWLLTPPVAFTVLFAVIFVLYVLSMRLAIKPAKNVPDKTKMYSCGEDLPVRRIQPDYAQFFPFAFFFTIMHVVALVLATIPAGGIASNGLGLVYIAGAVVGLIVLFKG